MRTSSIIEQNTTQEIYFKDWGPEILRMKAMKESQLTMNLKPTLPKHTAQPMFKILLFTTIASIRDTKNVALNVFHVDTAWKDKQNIASE